jgi:HlyD family secretion protein
MLKYLGIMFVVTLLAASIAFIDASSVSPEVRSEPSVYQGNIYAPGRVEGITQDIELRPEVSGRVEEVLVTTGAWVEAGDVLLRLDHSRQAQLVVASQASLELVKAQLQRLINGAQTEQRTEAKAMIRAKQAQLLQAQQTWKRVSELRNQGAISQQEADDQQGLVDRLHAELEAAQARSDQLTAPARADEIRVATARVSAAEAEQQLAQISLDKTELRAPSRGRILDVDVEAGEIVGPNGPAPVLVLSDTSTLNIRAFIEEIDAPRVQVGMRVQIVADGLPNQVLPGELYFLSPRMNRKTLSSDRPNELYDTKVREVLIRVDNALQLIVGLRVDVTILVPKTNK